MGVLVEGTRCACFAVHTPTAPLLAFRLISRLVCNVLDTHPVQNRQPVRAGSEHAELCRCHEDHVGAAGGRADPQLLPEVDISSTRSTPRGVSSMHQPWGSVALSLQKQSDKI